MQVLAKSPCSLEIEIEDWCCGYGVRTVDIHGRFSVSCFSHHNHNTNLKSQSHMYGELNKSIGRALQGLGNLAGAALESP